MKRTMFPGGFLQSRLFTNKVFCQWTVLLVFKLILSVVYPVFSHIVHAAAYPPSRRRPVYALCWEHETAKNLYFRPFSHI